MATIYKDIRTDLAAREGQRGKAMHIYMSFLERKSKVRRKTIRKRIQLERAKAEVDVILEKDRELNEVNVLMGNFS